MAVEFTVPDPRVDRAGSRVAKIEMEHIHLRMVVHMEDYDIGLNTINRWTFNVGTAEQVASGDAWYTFAQFNTLLPGASTIHTTIEQGLVNDGKLPPGTVT